MSIKQSNPASTQAHELAQSSEHQQDKQDFTPLELKGPTGWHMLWKLRLKALEKTEPSRQSND